MTTISFTRKWHIRIQLICLFGMLMLFQSMILQSSGYTTNDERNDVVGEAMAKVALSIEGKVPPKSRGSRQIWR